MSFRWRVFIGGFSAVLLLFVALNTYSYAQAVPPCCDAYAPFGVPLPLGETGGYFGYTHFVLSGLIVDTMIALGSSALLGALLVLLWPHILETRERWFKALRAWHETRL